MTSYTPSTLNYPQLADTPIRRVKFDHAPNNTKNFILGDEWLDTSDTPSGQWWKLSTFPTGGLIWVKIGGGAASIESLTGNTGGPVFTDTNSNINVIGDGTTITIAGNPGTNTLTVSSLTGGPLVIDGDVGSATGNPITFTTEGVAFTYGRTLQFLASGSTVRFQTSDSNANLFIGLACGDSYVLGVSTAQSNVGLGQGTLANVVSDFNNTGLGNSVLNQLNGGASNTGVGSAILQHLLTGSYNTVVGWGNHLGLAQTGGTQYTGAESSNILIGSPGVTGDNNVIRIGSPSAGDGSQSTCYIAGVIGNTVSNPEFVMIDSVSGQLGVSATPPISAAVSAYISPSTGNVTGDNTNYTVVYNTVIADATSSYNSATGVFTAPITGLYLVSTVLNIGNNGPNGLLPYNVCLIRAVNFTTNVETRLCETNPSIMQDVSFVYSSGGTALILLTAGDTFGIVLNVNNNNSAASPKTVGIRGVEVDPPYASNRLSNLLIRFIQ